MKTVLSDRMMDAVMELRKRGVFLFPCAVLVNRQKMPGLLGPRVEGCPRSIRVKVSDKIGIYPLGAISVDADVLAKITAIVAEWDAAAAKAAADREAESFERVSRQLFAQRGQARRRPSGRFAANDVEPAGRR